MERLEGLEERLEERLQGWEGQEGSGVLEGDGG